MGTKYKDEVIRIDLDLNYFARCYNLCEDEVMDLADYVYPIKGMLASYTFGTKNYREIFTLVKLADENHWNEVKRDPIWDRVIDIYELGLEAAKDKVLVSRGFLTEKERRKDLSESGLTEKNGKFILIKWQKEELQYQWKRILNIYKPEKEDYNPQICAEVPGEIKDTLEDVFELGLKWGEKLANRPLEEINNKTHDTVYILNQQDIWLNEADMEPLIIMINEANLSASMIAWGAKREDFTYVGRGKVKFICRKDREYRFYRVSTNRRVKKVLQLARLDRTKYTLYLKTNKLVIIPHHDPNNPVKYVIGDPKFNRVMD